MILHIITIVVLVMTELFRFAMSYNVSLCLLHIFKTTRLSNDLATQTILARKEMMEEKK